MMKILVTIILVMTYSCFLTGGVSGEKFCVSNSTELQDALTTAGINREDDIIQVVQGTYAGNFVYYSTRGYSIALKGGYTTGCTSREVDPANTILDGGRTDTVLIIENTTKGGNVHIEGLTIRNGNYSGDRSRPGGIEVSSWTDTGSAGYIKIANNIITANTSATNAGGVMVWNGSGPSAQQADVILDNNIIRENTVGFHGGGIYIYYTENTGPAGNIVLKNNLVMDNKAIKYGTGGIVIGTVYYTDSPVGPYVLLSTISL